LSKEERKGLRITMTGFAMVVGCIMGLSVSIATSVRGLGVGLTTRVTWDKRGPTMI